MLLMRSIAIRLLVALLALASLSGTALSATSGTPSRVVRVGVYENPPKVYTDDDGKPAGLFIDLLREIARHEKWQLRFQSCHWHECLKSLQAGKIDLMPDVAYTSDRAKRFDFPALPEAYGWAQVYKRKNSKLDSLASLSGHRIAVLRDSVQEQYLKQLLASNNISFDAVPVASYAEGFAATRDGDTDAVVTNNFFGGRFSDKYGLVEMPVIFDSVSLYFATGKGRHADLLRTIDSYTANWRRDPDSVYFTILHRAMAPTPLTLMPHWVRPLIISTVAAALLLLLLFVIALRWQVRRTSRRLANTQRHLDQVIDSSPAVLYELELSNGTGRPLWVSSNIETLFGYSPAEALTEKWWVSHIHEDDRETAIRNFAMLAHMGRLTQEYRFIDGHGKTRYIRDELRVNQHDDTGTTIVGSWSDLTEQQRQASELEFLSYHDPLTRLANNTRLRNHMDVTLAAASEEHRKPAVIWIDFDRFKLINESLGRAKGDRLLREAARRLELLTSPDDLVARVGGDEFALYIHDAQTLGDIESRMKDLFGAFETPLETVSPPIVMSPSAGIGRYPADGRDADTLLKSAETAADDAKQAGRNTYRLFDASLSAVSEERMLLQSALRHAVEREQLRLHYQPQIDLRSGHLIGMEALVRWEHPEMGLVSPARFIPLAEELDLIDTIGAWVLEEACRQTAQWDDQGWRLPGVAVNLSVRQLRSDKLIGHITRVLSLTGLTAERLELEITESMIMRNPEQAIGALEAISNLGVKLAVDDFGTGHSSLAYLKRLPLDRLKIDKSFVGDIGRHERDKALCRSIIDLAHQLNLETVAEGVENAEQKAFLRTEGCEYAQGFLFYKPLPAAEMEALLASSAPDFEITQSG